MSVELLSALDTKDSYDRYSRFIKQHTVSSQTWKILKDMGVWYEKKDDIVWEKFAEWFKLRHPKLGFEDVGLYDRMFKRLEDTDLDDDVVKEIVSSFVDKDFCQHIAEHALAIVDDGDGDPRKFEKMLHDWHHQKGMVSDLEKFEVSDDIEDLLKAVDEGGTNWRLNFLNEAIGTCRKGKLYIWAARPNSGKTTLMASEFTKLAEESNHDEVLLWFNNEEDGLEVKMRHWSALLQQPQGYITSHPKRAKAEIEAKIGDISRIRLIDKPGFSVEDVHSYINKYDGKVAGIVFDQLWKVRGFEKTSTTDVDRQQKLFAWARELAKQYCPVWTSHQLKGDAEGVAYPDMSMLYGSTTAIQGEADVIIMLGNKNEMGLEDLRHISIAKVKGAYGPFVDPSKRNGKADLEIDGARAMFIEE